MYFSVCQLFNFCVCWYCLIIKLNVFFPEVLSNRLNTFYTSSSHSIHSIHPITHMLCVCVCLFLCPSNLCFTFYFSLLSMTMKTMHLIWLLLLTNPYSSKTICQFSIMMTIAFSLVQRSGIGSHHIYCDKISCFLYKQGLLRFELIMLGIWSSPIMEYFMK